jgi:hypothetical protein
MAWGDVGCSTWRNTYDLDIIILGTPILIFLI